MATMLGRGLYDATEVALLLAVRPELIVRLSTDSRSGPAVVRPSFDRRFSFAELIGLRVALEIRRLGVGDRDLRKGLASLKKRTELEAPLVVRSVIARLAMSGSSLLWDLGDGEFDDLGRGSQGVFPDVIRLHLRRIHFNTDGDANRWEPVDGVALDPAIQAGAPCVAGTRIPTAVVVGLLVTSDAEDVALDLDLSPAQIRAARKFEGLLAGQFGLAA